MRSSETLTVMQVSFIMALAKQEHAMKAPNERGDCWVTRDFFKEWHEIPRWQTYHTELLRQMVLQEWLDEYCGQNGTLFYRLTEAGRNVANERIFYAQKYALCFNPHNQPSLFDRQKES